MAVLPHRQVRNQVLLDLVVDRKSCQPPNLGKTWKLLAQFP